MASLRKNGLPSSCEPCRKSKLRCDHQIPVCGRCARRKKSSQCVYRPSTRPESAQPSRPRVAADAPRPSLDLATQPIWENRAIARRRLSQSEYMGMTSHFAVFKEGADNLGISTTSATPETNQDTTNPMANAIQIESDEVRRGAHILHLLKDLPLYRQAAEDWIRKTNGCDFLGRPLIDLTFNSLEESLDIQWGDTDDLFSRSRQIFQMFSNTIPMHSSLTFDEYMKSMSCRWEVIGLAFSFAGMGVALPGDPNPELQLGNRSFAARKELGEVALSATETCLAFCNNAGVLNDAVSWLTSQGMLLATLIYGDKDYRSWRALGDMSTIVFSLGINQPSSSLDTPFWLVETRKRLMGHAYSADKQLATFLGRPPRISWRFCSISLPLDLSFTDIIASDEVRNLAISQLDSDGWNTVENDRQAVWLRVTLMMGVIRESILELSLNQQVENLSEKVQELLQKAESVWASLPTFLHRQYEFAESAQADPLNTPNSLYLHLHLEHIYDRFLLYRILSKRLNMWSPDLITASHEILNGVLLFIKFRMRSMRFTTDISWVVSFFGLSSAGVLSIELVRRASHMNLDTSSNAPFPRSRVIQNLSIFASYLETIIQPHEGNYDICQQARETIGRVLDFVLAAEDTQPASIMPDSNSRNQVDLGDGILDYNYYITHLDNWQFELQDTLQMFD